MAPVEEEARIAYGLVFFGGKRVARLTSVSSVATSGCQVVMTVDGGRLQTMELRSAQAAETLAREIIDSIAAGCRKVTRSAVGNLDGERRVKARLAAQDAREASEAKAVIAAEAKQAAAPQMPTILNTRVPDFFGRIAEFLVDEFMPSRSSSSRLILASNALRRSLILHVKERRAFCQDAGYYEEYISGPIRERNFALWRRLRPLQMTSTADEDKKVAIAFIKRHMVSNDEPASSPCSPKK